MIGNQGTASTVSIQYDRPWRGGNDNNFNDQVTQTSGSPLAIEVFEGPLLTVTPTASATTVPAGSTVSFSATYEPSNVSGVTYNWKLRRRRRELDRERADRDVQHRRHVQGHRPGERRRGRGGVGRDSDHGHVVDAADRQQQRAAEGAATTAAARAARFRASIKVATGVRSQREQQQRVHGRSALELADVGEPWRDDARRRPRGSGTTTPASRPSSPAVTPPATTHSVTPRSRGRQQTSHLKAAPPPAPGAQAPVVTGQLVSDVTPLPAGESPLVHVEAGVAATSQAARTRSSGSPLGPIVGGLAVIALLALGARRELRGKRDWRTLRFGS